MDCLDRMLVPVRREPMDCSDRMLVLVQREPVDCLDRMLLMSSSVQVSIGASILQQALVFEVKAPLRVVVISSAVQAQVLLEILERTRLMRM